MSKIVAKLMDFDQEEGTERLDMELLAGVTDFDKVGLVELNLNYQDNGGVRHDLYVSFKLTELLAAIARDHGTDLL